MIVVIGRIFAIIVVYYAALFYFKKQTISFWDLMFIAYGGMIRGAIAFALVMKIPYVGSPLCTQPEYCFTKEEYDLAVSTTLALVMFTTLLFGTFMKKASNWLTSSGKETKEIRQTDVEMRKTAKSLHSIKKSVHSYYDTMIHPNLEA